MTPTSRSTGSLPWAKRQEIPDAQIKDAADQFADAAFVLKDLPPGSGVLLPLLNAASVGIELYLKSLSATLVHTPDTLVEDLSVVTAKPVRRGHGLVALLDALDADLRVAIESRFCDEHPASKPLAEVLASFEGMLEASRYQFEHGQELRRYNLASAMSCVGFLKQFVGDLQPHDRAWWT